MVNIISLDFLRKVHPGVTLIEPTHCALQGVTGSQLKTMGKTMLTITLAGCLQFDITATAVGKSSSQGNLLIGFETKRDEDIATLPERRSLMCLQILTLHQFRRQHRSTSTSNPKYHDRK